MAKPKKKTTPKAAPRAAKSRAPKSRAAAPAPATDGKLDADTLSAELRQLSAIRGLFPTLDRTTADALLASHDADVCREKGTATRSSDTLRIAMRWARLFGENVDDPAVDNASVRVRWFLDCLNVLGSAIAGRAVSDDPTAQGRYQDSADSSTQLLTRTARRVRAAAGTHQSRLDAIDRALAPDDSGGEPLIGRLRRLARLIDGWRSSTGADAPPLSAYGITQQTVYRLRDAAQALEDVVATRPAPRQADRDTPAINTAEGRLFFVMRTLWDDFTEARQDGVTSLQLPTSPALIRGLDMKSRRSSDSPVPPPAPPPS